jgi:lipid-binding SYLF domain-containing protein
MKKIIYIVLIFLGLNLQAGQKQESIVISAVNIMNEIMSIPESSIPPKLLRNAKAIAIIPHVIKVGFVIGGRFGRGILSVRQKNGRWSAPCFINLTGGSIGWQIGAQSSDIVLVFKTRRGVDGIVGGKFTLGADAAIAAGPVGRNASAATDATMSAEIYSYSRSKGLFLGVSLAGSSLAVNNAYNAIYYNKNIYPTDIFKGYRIKVPRSGRVLIDTIIKYTR